MGFSLSDLDFISPIVGKGGIIDEIGRGIDKKLLGGDAADAAEEAASLQAIAGEKAAALFDPFVGLGASGIEQAGFLTDPNQQFQFLQSNPLFQLGLDNLNQQTARSAAASGRVGATDTNQQLINNALLAASPLIQQQKASIGDLLNIGLGTAGSQGNLLTGIGAAQAGGVVGAANARQQGVGNLLNLAGTIGAMASAPGAGAAGAGAAGAGASSGLLASDLRLKENIEFTGTENGHKKYKWKWNGLAEKLGLSGTSSGVIAQEVEQINPNAVVMKDGFKHVNYELIGVSNGN